MLTTLRKLKERLYSNFQYVIKTKRTYKISSNGKYAIINLDNHFGSNDMGRYSYILCQYFRHAGYDIIIKTNKSFFKKISKYKKPLLKQKFLFVRNCSTPVNSIVLKNAGKEFKTIQLYYGYDLAQSNSCDCVASYPLHPKFYEEYPAPEQFELLRNFPRVMRIFFSGNVNMKTYKKNDIQQQFNIINRFDLLNDVKEHFKNTSKLIILSSKEELLHLLRQNENRELIFINEDKTDSKDWLEVLGKSDFFLCPPGAYMPWCHNLIESMSVGTIPILQYAHLCFPPLVHMENCLIFKNFKELQETIELALKIQPDEIARIRKNVVAYYDSYLSLPGTTGKIKTFSGSTQAKTSVAVPYIPKE